MDVDGLMLRIAPSDTDILATILDEWAANYEYDPSGYSKGMSVLGETFVPKAKDAAAAMRHAGELARQTHVREIVVDVLM